jgi:hypothetical protein
VLDSLGTAAPLSLVESEVSERPVTTSQPVTRVKRSDPERTERGRGSARTNGALPWTLCALLLTGFALWLGFAWSGYGDRYAQATEGWRKGGTHLVEITLVREDVNNLACASDVTFEGLHCGYRADRQPFEDSEEESRVLRPYSTTSHQLLMGAGLWSSLGLSVQLPSQRFTVVCNYHLVGAVKSASLRWSPNGRFEPLERSLSVGSLSDCSIPP